MRIILSIVLVLSMSVHADQIKMKSLACPTLEVFEKIPPKALEDDLELSLFAVANNCKILSRSDGVNVIGYDPGNDKSTFVQILVKQTGETLYIRSKNLIVEQPGKKNTIRF